MDTYANGATTSSGYQQIHSSETFYFKEEKQVYSRTNEIAKVAGDHSNRIRVTFQSTSSYVSPLIDLASTHTIFIGNLVNSNTYGESAASGGYALNKYISQNVTLADGQDAEDINVYLTAYKPPGTDVQVYAKLLNANDTDSLNQKPWLQLAYKADGAITYSSLSDRTNFIEFSYQIPTQYMTGPLGEYQYVANGSTYTGYKYFAIKIVLIANNSAIVPRASDLRVIALQV
jgi:hypothetical protein